jgi:hypothetical protein
MRSVSLLMILKQQLLCVISNVCNTLAGLASMLHAMWDHCCQMMLECYCTSHASPKHPKDEAVTPYMLSTKLQSV